MWIAEVEIIRRDGTLKKTIDIVVSSTDIETLRINPIVIRRALKYSGYTSKSIGEVKEWRIKSIIIKKKLGLW